MAWLLTLFFPVLLLATPALAGGPLVFAFDELPPWKTFSDGHAGGPYVDIVRELARRLGVETELVHCPIKRCMFMLEHGTADITIGYRDTPERRQYLHFLATPYRARSADRVFYVMADKGVEIREYADLAGLRIGTKLGAGYFERFDSDKMLLKAVVRDTDTNFRKLTLGRVDVVVVPEDQGEAILARLGMRHLFEKAQYRQPDPTSRAVAVARRSPFAARIEELEQAMAAMARDGTLLAIFRRHAASEAQLARQ